MMRVLMMWRFCLMKKKMLLCHYGDNVDQYDAKKDGFAGFTKRGVYYDFGM